MKRALWAVPLLVALGAWFARGAYTYYYTENGASPTWSNWIVENSGGTLGSYSSGGLSGIAFSSLYPGSGRMTYPSTSGSPGEVKLTLRMPTPLVGTGNAIAYLSASTDLSAPGASPGAGSGYRIYFQYNSTSSYYWLSKIIGGGFNVVASGSAGPGHDLMTLRFVRNSNGLILGYLDNVRFLDYYDLSYFSGRTAVELTRSPDDVAPGPLVSQIDLGNLDSTPPNAISSGSISVTPFYNHVDIQWPVATDDTNGSGVYGYEVYRDGWQINSTTGTSFSDATVLPNTTYAYMLAVRDFHGNYSTTNFNVTTPSVAPDGRRVGVRTTGAYWGAGGENIDVLSGNLNFTLPLLNAKSRSGWGVGVNLNYNSQNWRYDSNTTWKYGVDVGYGFGWRLMAGSITPMLSDAYTINYYLFTDSTGAEYRLDQNSSNVWSSKESTYVYFDANDNRLWFTNGSWWDFGCTSAANEADSGVMYPTNMEDSNGNQVIVRYQTGAGASGTNSSARITGIEDVRAIQTNPPASYVFAYNTDSTPHLTSITSYIGTGETYTFSYLTGQALSAPFNSQAFGTTTMLRDVTITGNSTYQEFTYNGSGELTQILLPYKGYLAYDYTTTAYPNGHSYREVVHRYLSKDGISSTQYPFSHEASPTGPIHQFTQLDDPGGVGEKYWAFASSGASAGLVTQYQGRQMPGQVPKVQNDYTWTQDAAGNNYIGSATTTADPTQTYAAAKKTDQTVDIHGNVTQIKTYDYGNLTTPVRTDNYTYLSDSWYYLFNRVTSTPTTTIAYDEFSTTSAPGDAHEWSALLNGGNPTTITSPAGTQTVHYDFAGGVVSNTVNGLSSSVTSTNATNYAAPSQVTVGSLSNGMSYSSFLGLTNETDANGASTSIGYDAMARPGSTTSPFGATTTVAYYDTASPPYSQTTVNGRWTRTTLDGLGRTVKTETGDGSGTKSVAETVYDSCGCSPTGKMKQTALPHAPGATPVWTTYTYDGIGRTLSVSTVGTETTSTTNYVYQGNTVTVTDAAGKWKKYTMNALGQLIQVNEPNPGSSGVPGNHGSFVGADTTTQGNWHGVYGSDGYNVIGGGNSYPSYVTVTPSGNNFYPWADPTTDVIGLYRDASSTTRISDTWYNYPSWTLDFSFSDTSSHNVAIYMVDWYTGNARNQTVDVLDGSTGAVLDTRNVTSFGGGQYWVWSLSGHVVLRFSVPAINAVINGIFFDSSGGGGGGGGSDYVTTYSYDTLGHLTSVSMPRPTGTQTRTFNYGTPPGAQLLSATNPENGTVTYTYNTDKTLATKTDAKNQQVKYSYDSYKRVTQIRRGIYSGTFTEDTCQQENYSYDTNPYDGSFSLYTSGRLAAVQYQGGNNGGAYGGTCNKTFTEMYSYSQAGGMVKKRLQVTEQAQNYYLAANVSMNLDATYTYDNEGRMTATQYPSSWGGTSWLAGPNLGNTFDSMGRLQKLTDLASSNDIISNASYGAAGQLLSMTGAGGAPSETRTYNSIGQMTQLQSGSLNIQYAYSATQNNGKITSQTDVVSGEQIVYTYDSMNRLASATGYGWGQSYGYDGFGNMTNQTVTSGSAPALSTTYDPATNRQTGECADANGNINAIGAYPCWTGYTYDIENRIVTQGTYNAGSNAAYSYAPGNKRVWRGVWSSGGQTADEVTFWSINGQKLETYQLSQYQPWPGDDHTMPQLVATQTGTNYYFGGKLVKNTGGYVTPDRLGSIGKYFPYGQERPSATTDGKEKFATYFRDSETGLDYANARYHQPGMGRFMTADSAPSANAKDPGSWNRYAYVEGDPINHVDFSGNDFCDANNVNFFLDGVFISSTGCGDAGPVGPYGVTIDLAAIISASIVSALGAAGCDAAAISAFQSTGSAAGGTCHAPPSSAELQCPLVAPTGNFTLDPNSENPIHAIFAPDMAAALSAAFASLNAQGIVPMITSGFRTKTENESLRDSPNGNSRVSNHLVGEAIDINRNDPNFEKIKAAMLAAGLTWGGTFSRPDRPHFQLPAAGHNPTQAQIDACDREHPGGR